MFPTGSLSSYTALIRGVGQAKASFFLFSETLSGKREKPGPAEQFLKVRAPPILKWGGGRERGKFGCSLFVAVQIQIETEQ